MKVLVVRPSSLWLPALTRVLVVRPLETFLEWWMEACHLYKTHLILVINWNTTRGGGCLGSHIDEERSKLRYVVRFAELVSHRIFERKWRSREILRARLFEGPFIRFNHFGFVYELWHKILLCQCWVVRLLAHWVVWKVVTWNIGVVAVDGSVWYNSLSGCCWWCCVKASSVRWLLMVVVQCIVSPAWLLMVLVLCKNNFVCPVELSKLLSFYCVCLGWFVCVCVCAFCMCIYCVCFVWVFKRFSWCSHPACLSTATVK